MRAILQRVSQAKVTSEGQTLAEQDLGFLVLLGVTTEDTDEDLNWMVKKIANIRIFEDEDGKMNRSITDVQGEITVVSQFTLLASTKKGNRPSFLDAAKPDISEPLYEQFCESLSTAICKPVGRGRFGATMQISLVNEGPVTISLDSKNLQ
ncbi:MAG: D-aminoacyl-tRNA deacylase [Roseibacillus sp.]